MTIRKTLVLFVILTVGAAAAGAQSGLGETIAVPISDPSQPLTLRASLINGGLTVRGYEGSEVLVVASERVSDADGDSDSDSDTDSDSDSDRSGEGRDRAGMVRIPSTGFGLTISEKDNQVTISTEWSRRPVDLSIQVPRRTSLRLSTINNGDLRIEGVSGEHELSNTNGSIHAHGVSGSVVANTTNGPVEVTFVDMVTDQPMSFATWNGDVDVTLPAGLRADVKLEAGQGDVYSDFDVELRPVQTRTQREGRNGAFRVKLERAVEGTIGGGGAQLHFKTFNGDIYLRRQGGP